MARTWILVLLIATGCFPYHETYRHEYGGRVVDVAGQPVAGARVESCSASKWSGLDGGCPRRAALTTTADGQFRFTSVREWEWCCLGEAPLPFTVTFVCVPDGRVAVHDGDADGTLLTVDRPPTAPFDERHMPEAIARCPG